MSLHLSREAQTIAALEFTALAHHYIIAPRQSSVRPKMRRHIDESARIDAARARPDDGSWNALRLAEFLKLLRGDTRDLEPGSAERLFRNYVKLLPELVPGLECNLQSGYVSNYNNPIAQIKLCRRYFREFAGENERNGLPADHNDAAIRKYVYCSAASALRREVRDSANALYTLVHLRFAIKYQFPIGAALSRNGGVRFEEILPQAVFCEGTALMLAYLNSRGEQSVIHLAELLAVSSDLSQRFTNRKTGSRSDIKDLKKLMKLRSREAVCEIPAAHLVHCLSSLPDFVDVDYADQDVARVTLRGTEEALRSAILHVLPYVTTVEPADLVQGVCRDVAEMARVINEAGNRAGAI
jgi:hypothetical protein